MVSDESGDDECSASACAVCCTREVAGDDHAYDAMNAAVNTDLYRREKYLDEGCSSLEGERCPISCLD